MFGGHLTIVKFASVTIVGRSAMVNVAVFTCAGFVDVMQIILHASTRRCWVVLEMMAFLSNPALRMSRRHLK